MADHLNTHSVDLFGVHCSLTDEEHTRWEEESRRLVREFNEAWIVRQHYMRHNDAVNECLSVQQDLENAYEALHAFAREFVANLNRQPEEEESK